MRPSTTVLKRVLAPSRSTSVVDVGANPIDGDPPYKDMLDDGLCTVTGFEPQPEALAQLRAAAGPLETYLPEALGDGTVRQLHVAAASGMTSLLNPDPQRLALFNGFSDWGTVVGRLDVPTTRLDDVAALHHVDLLKIDVQGAELMVFQNGRRKLSQAVAIHTEVSFVPLYEDQPPFGEVDLELRRQGFLPHAFHAVKRWALAPVVYGGDFRVPNQQLLEADVVYVRDVGHLELMDDDQLSHLALLADAVYGSTDLAHLCLAELIRRGAAEAGAAVEYLAAV